MRISSPVRGGRRGRRDGSSGGGGGEGDDEECARAWFSKYTVEEKNRTVHSGNLVRQRREGQKLQVCK